MTSIRTSILATVLLFAPMTSMTDELSISYEDIIEEDNTKILKGNVVIAFSGIRFEADQVIQTLADNLPVKYEAKGNPVLLKQEGNTLPGLDQATSEKLIYLVREKILMLEHYEIRLVDGSVQKGKKFKVVLE